jgi:hypothetical protein
MSQNKRYYSLNQFFRNTFGCRVHKIELDGGFSCPNRDGTKGTGGCIYCNSHGSGPDLYHKGFSISEQIKKGVIHKKRRFHAKKFIAYFQSFSNTYATTDELKQKYDEALCDDSIVGLSIGSRPDCINRETFDLLEDYKKNGYMVWLELGLQSIHNKTLNLINRKHTFEEFLVALEEARKRELMVCIHIIFGLPEETYEDMLETIDVVAGLDINGIKFHSLYIAEGSPMEDLYKEKKYNPITQDTYVYLVCEALGKLPEHIVIQRLTSEPLADELIAPLWALDKKGTIELIEKRLTDLDIWQGKYLSSEK